MHIVYQQKPIFITWDEVQECQWKSHEYNRRNGLYMHCQSLSGKELEQNIGGGICFVALDNKKVVGTASVKIIGKSKRWCWWNKNGNCAYFCMDGVIPEYQGKHVYSNLQEMRYGYVIEKGLSVIEIDTAEDNKHMLAILKKQGFHKVSLSAFQSTTYYSVILAKWMGKTTLSSFSVFVRYIIAYIITKLLWKRGKRPRFPFIHV